MLDIFDFDIKIATLGGVVRIPVCTKAEHDMMIAAEGDEEKALVIVKICREHNVKISGKLPIAEAARVFDSYDTKIQAFIEKNKEILTIPHSALMDAGQKARSRWPQKTTDLKIVYDYTGIDFKQLEQMGYLQFLFLLCEAVKYNMAGSEIGIDMLNAAYEEQILPFDRKKFLSGG